MKSSLPAAHLFRQFLLFALVVVFLLTMGRAAYALWHFPALEETNAFVDLFVTGLRYDLFLVGIFCAVPVVLGSFLAMFSATRSIAKWLVGVILFGGLIIILLLEMITPWFVENQGLRPDLNMLTSVEDPVGTFQYIAVYQLIPLIMAVLLFALILVAYWTRMELYRFLRYPVSKLGGLLTLVVGGALCAFAIHSKLDLTPTFMEPAEAQISSNDAINDITMNTTYKVLYSVVAPLLK